MASCLPPQIVVAACLTGLSVMLIGRADADVVRLSTGGEVRGTLLSKPQDAEVVIRTPIGSTYRFDRRDVAGASKRSPRVEEYHTRALVAAKAGTVDAHRELADWCRGNRLTQQRREQLEAIVAISPNDEAANRELGHRLLDGDWVSEGEWAAERGLVEYEGRFVSPAMREALTEADLHRERRKLWFRRLRSVHAAILSRRDDRYREARVTLRTVNDPAAAEAVGTLFQSGRLPVEVRLDAVTALGSIGGVESVEPLVKFAVFDRDPEVREVAAAALDPEAADDAVRVLVPHLLSRSRPTVLAATAALDRVAHPAAIPKLIPALNTTHTQTVRVRDDSPTFGVGGGNIGFGAQPSINAAALSAAGAYTPILPPGSQPRYVSKRLRVQHQNDAVRTLLVALTGQDFGFDENRWWAWFRRNRQ